LDISVSYLMRNVNLVTMKRKSSTFLETYVTKVLIFVTLFQKFFFHISLLQLLELLIHYILLFFNNLKIAFMVENCDFMKRTSHVFAHIIKVLLGVLKRYHQIRIGNSIMF
jgi:uncharacterized membrane protein YesL